jgi:hypothetical protein
MLPSILLLISAAASLLLALSPLAIRYNDPLLACLIFQIIAVTTLVLCMMNLIYVYNS